MPNNFASFIPATGIIQPALKRDTHQLYPYLRNIVDTASGLVSEGSTSGSGRGATFLGVGVHVQLEGKLQAVVDLQEMAAWDRRRGIRRCVLRG